MGPETAVSEKRDQANIENHLQDQSIKSQDIVVSVTTSALSRWKYTPLQQDVGGNKGTRSLSLPSYMNMILEEGAYVKYICKTAPQYTVLSRQ